MQLYKELQLYLKTNNTQNCQKIELYGSLTTKDLEKPHFIEMDKRCRVTEMDREAWRLGVLWRGSGSGRTDDPTFTCGG